MGSLSEGAIRRIAIVGGGPSGLATAKFLLAERRFDTIDIFEQTDSVQGVWQYSPLDSHEGTATPVSDLWTPFDEPHLEQGPDGRELAKTRTAMYDELETNIPHPWMSFSDAPFPPKSQLFPPRQAVSAYLEEYAKDVRHLIKFHTEVVDVRLESEGPDRWAVRTKDLLTTEEATRSYDAVVVCAGHYNVPNVPSFGTVMERWQEEYPGSIIHSKYFRNTEAYRDQKVLIVGNAASAVDISAHIKCVSQKPILISSRSESWLSTGKSSPGVKSVREIQEFYPPENGRRGILFSDGHVEEDVDKVVLCTGYLYSFPFLRSLGQCLIDDGLSVHNLYRQIFFIDHPTLAFPGLPLRILPFPMSEVQAAVIGRVWSGRLYLPSQEEMWISESEMAQANGGGKLYHTLTHPKDFVYHNRLYDWAAQTGRDVGKMGIHWDAKDYWVRERIPHIKQAFVARGEERHQVKTIEELGFDYNAWKRQQ